jgi:hypothetical protein
MAASPADGNVVISGRALALLASPAALRRLRVRYRADPVYDDLVVISAIVLAADGHGIAIGGGGQDPEYMTTAEFAASAGCSMRTVRRGCADGTIRAVRRSGVWLIPAGELARRLAC